LIRIALTTFGSRMPAPARRVAAAATCGAARDVPLAYFHKSPVDS
jgi:hypothetical protein